MKGNVALVLGIIGTALGAFSVFKLLEIRDQVRAVKNSEVGRVLENLGIL